MLKSFSQQVALDNALVAPEKRLKIEKCNTRIEFNKLQREATYQVTLDALKLSPCYPAFLITAKVPDIYMHQFWNTIKKIKDTDVHRFKLDKKKCRINTEVFCKIHQICLILPNKDFVEPPSKDEMVPFIQELGYSGKCISGKTIGLDRLRKSRAQILWGMYNKKNVDFVALLWEDFMFQADNKEISSSCKENMPYPRFTKVIISHVISKDKTISMRNRINLHTVRDDTLLATPKKERKFKKVASPSKKLSRVLEGESAKKPKRAKKPAKKSTTVPITGVVIRDTPGVSVSKKKALTKADRGKGMDLLFEAELLEAAQLKKTIKKSKLETHKLYESGSGDGVSSQPKSENESWGDSDDDSNDDDSDDASNNDDDDVDSDAGEEEYEEEYIRTPDRFEFTNDDEEYEELYKDVNVKLKATEHEEERKGDAEMTDAGHDDGTQQTTYEQVKDDKLVCHEEPSTQTPSLLNIIVTVIPETSTTTGPTILPTIPPITSLPQQSTPTPTPAPTTATTTTSIPTLPYFYPYSDSIKEFLPWKKRYLNLNKLTILLNSSQLSNLKFLQLSNTAEFKKKSQAERKRYINLVENSMKDIIKYEVKSQLHQILPKEVSEFTTSVIQSTITESLENVVLAKSSSQPKSTYEAAASLTEFELKNILLDKMQKNREDKDKDEDPSAGSDQGLKRRKTSKDAEPSKGSKSKESKSSLSKSTKSQSKSFEPERHPTPDPDWNTNKSIDFRPPQTWIRKFSKVKKPPLTFDELMSTSIDFSAYVINNLKIDNLTQEYLDGPAVSPKLNRSLQPAKGDSQLV
ncbi:hypothetical protein Tco_1091131 [Tanacetum coccineum]|uniref:Uncharacterized protein n=1 Tax=Tanacetum coccineum TaxID=301880 RepID=A0ABQ5I658_9ASTR